MRITDLLDARSILLDASPKSKSEALDQIVDLMVKSEKINDKEAYRKQVYAREEESTTGIGEGIAIPHGKCDAVTKPGLAAMWMYTDGTARWNLRIPCSGKCNHVSGGTGSRNCNFSGITRSTQKENCIKNNSKIQVCPQRC